MSETSSEPSSSEPALAGGEEVPPKRDLRAWIVEIFVAFNLGFLAVDVYMAHAANEFADPLEWIPVYFSAIVPILLVPGIITKRYDQGIWRWVGIGVGALSLLVGLGGMFLHLESAFFQLQTIKSLVYSAPFIAPLAYAGVGLLLLLNRMQKEAWGDWIVFMALGGMVGNFILSLLDHAQNGFFEATEYIPVVAAGFGVGFLLLTLFANRDRFFLKVTIGVMVLCALVGVAGFGLHLWADLESEGSSLAYKFLYGAPVFAPLLFPNIALLAGIGLWDMFAAAPEVTETPSESTASAPPADATK